MIFELKDLFSYGPRTSSLEVLYVLVRFLITKRSSFSRFTKRWLCEMNKKCWNTDPTWKDTYVGKGTNTDPTFLQMYGTA